MYIAVISFSTEGTYYIFHQYLPFAGDKKVGERVVVYPWLGCENCGLCSCEETNLCQLNLANAIGIGREGG